MEYINRLLKKRPNSTPPFPTNTSQLDKSTGDAFPDQRQKSEESITRLSKSEYGECPSSLSSASSFQSLVGSLSSKCSSGICADSPSSPDSPEKALDRSYVNAVPDLDDLIAACAGINLDSTTLADEAQPDNFQDFDLLRPETPCSQDLSQDQTFTSANESITADSNENDNSLIVQEAPKLNSPKNQTLIPFVTLEEQVFKNQNFITPTKSDLTVPSNIIQNLTPCEEVDILVNHSDLNGTILGTTADVFSSTYESSNSSSCQALTSFPGSFIDQSNKINEIPNTRNEKQSPFQEEQEIINENLKDSQNKDSVPLQNKALNELLKHNKGIKIEFNLDDTVPLSPVVRDTPNETVNDSKDLSKNLNSSLLNQSSKSGFEESIFSDKKLEENSNLNGTFSLNKSEIKEVIKTPNKSENDQHKLQEDCNVTETSLKLNQEIESQIVNDKEEVLAKSNTDETSVNKSKLEEDAETEFKIINQCDQEKLLKNNNLVETSLNKTEIKEKFENRRDIQNDSFEIANVEKENNSLNTSVHLNNSLNLEENVASTVSVNNDEKSTDTNCLNESLLANEKELSHVIEENKNYNTIESIDTFVEAASKTPQKFNSDLDAFKSITSLNNSSTEESQATNNIQSESPKEIKESLNNTLVTNNVIGNIKNDKNKIANEILNSTVDIHNTSLNNIVPTESEYEKFTPQKQSTKLVSAEQCSLEEAALSIAKDIESSIENIEETEQFVSATNEIFQDASAFDFFNKLGATNKTLNARNDSIYLRFDPLANRQSMLPQMPQKSIPDTSEEEEKEITMTKTEEAPVTNFKTPKKTPALAAIDRLLFYSPLTPSGNVTEPVEPKQNKDTPEKQETPIVDENMAKDLEVVKSTVIQLEDEIEKLKLKNTELEKKNLKYEEREKESLNKISKIEARLAEETKCKEQMTVVVDEYEKSISRLIAEREKEKTNFELEKARIQEELQVAQQHLNNTEAAFSDVHSKYERLKNVVSAYKTNETVLKESIVENQQTIKTLENKYDQLKSHAVAQLDKANVELSNIRKQHEADTVKLKAMVRRAELKSKSLEETVEQKIKENKELTKIIDEMIARVE